MNYRKLDQSDADQAKNIFGQEGVDHLHFNDGFSIGAFDGDQIAGLIAAYFKSERVVFIDIIEVAEQYRRQGIGKRLVDMGILESKAQNMVTIESWSSLDKTEAIEMWKNLGFELKRTKTMSRITKGLVEGFIVSREI
jgi:ribosomal protein S18 acetylase RimI-like enzyme